MVKIPTILPISDLRQDAAGALKRVQNSASPLVVTQRGRPAAVLLSMDAYERDERERQMLRELARGELEIGTGKGRDLDAVLADADRMLRNAGV